MDIPPKKLQRLIFEMSNNSSEDALKEIYVAFYPKLLRLATYYVRETTISEEIVSDTFLSIWEQRTRLSEVQDFSAYVYRVSRNIAISYFRKQTKGVESVDVSTIHTYFDPADNPESEFISSELMESLTQAIEMLPERCKLVFKLIREEKLKYKEVASMLNISVKTVDAHMALAVKRLREALKNNMN